MDFAKLHEVLLQLVAIQFKVEAADEDLTLWVCELHFVFLVFARDAVFLHDLHVGIRLLDLLSIATYEEMVAILLANLIAATLVATISLTLMIISRLHINALL